MIGVQQKPTKPIIMRVIANPADIDNHINNVVMMKKLNTTITRRASL